MVAQGRGGGKTPARVVELINNAVKESSQVIVASGIGITRLTVQNYMKGIGEPSQATLEKLAAYFVKSVAWLRGGTTEQCTWGQYCYDDVDCSVWHPECGDRPYCFIEGSPAENEMKFCCYCGKLLIEKPYVIEQEDDDV